MPIVHPVPDDDLYDQGYRDGYRRGENERDALAAANSDLRSEVLSLLACLPCWPCSTAVKQQLCGIWGQQ